MALFQNIDGSQRANCWRYWSEIFNKTVQGAYKAYRFKSLTKSERKARENKIRLIKRWCKNNNSIMEFLGQIEFEILKGSWGPNEHFDEKLVTAILISNGYKIEELGFTVKELLKYGEC